MEPVVVKKKILESTGTVGWGMMGLGNAILIFFLLMGMQGTAIIADLFWCITLDIGAIILYFKYDERLSLEWLKKNTITVKTYMGNVEILKRI